MRFLGGDPTTAGRRSKVMADAPETRYTRSSEGTNLAYQMSGDGPLELVFVPAPIPICWMPDIGRLKPTRARRCPRTLPETVGHPARLGHPVRRLSGRQYG